MKEISVTADQLETLMDDLEAMLAEQDALHKPSLPDATPVEALVPEPAVEPAEVEAEKPEPEPESMAAASVIEPAIQPAEEPAEEEVEVPDLAPPPPVSTPPAASVYVGPVGAKGTMQHFIEVGDFQADTHISEVNLDDALIRQSGMRAFYGAQAAYAEGQAARVKAKFDILEARIYDDVRKKLAATSEKVTEKMVENAVKQDPRWLAGKLQVIEAGTIADVNKGLTFAMADRRDMLIQLCSDRRKDMDGQIRITAQQAERESLADRARAALQNSRERV